MVVESALRADFEPQARRYKLSRRVLILKICVNPRNLRFQK